MTVRSKRASDEDDFDAEQRRTASPVDVMHGPPIRFPIVSEVRYKLVTSKGTVRIGTGETINISRTGVLFRADTSLPPGQRIELSISWPVELDDKCGLKLVAHGRIVRCEGADVALKVDKYEFRTAGRVRQSHGRSEPAET